MKSSHQKLDAPSSKPGRKQPVSTPVQSSKAGHPYLPLYRREAQAPGQPADQQHDTAPTVSHQLKWDRENPKAKWAHQALRSALNKRLIERGPCEVCGAVHGEDGAVIHGHHDDYDKPMAVRWLCMPHHRQHHAAERRANRAEGTDE